MVTVRLCPPPDAGQEEAEEKLLEAQNVSFSHRLVALSLESSPSGTGGEGPGEGDGVLCARPSRHRCLLKWEPPGRPAREALQAGPAG